MKRTVRGILVALTLVAVYILWQPEPTRKELVVHTSWAVTPATAEVVSTSAEKASVPVDTGSVFVYVDEDGNVTYRGQTAHGVALAEEGFINYPRTPAQLVVQNPAGAFRASLPVSGYPFFAGDRLFVISSAGGTLSEWSADGARVWEMELAAPLTAVDASSELVGMGLVAGGPVALANDGTPVELQRSSASLEPIVYAVSVAEDEPRLAVVSGVPPSSESTDAEAGLAATVTLYDLESGRGVPVVRRRIRRGNEVAPLVRLFDRGAKLLYTDQRDGPMLVDLAVEEGEDVVVPLTYPAREILALEEPSLRAVLTVDPQQDPSRGFAHPAELLLADADGVVPIRTGWASDDSALYVHESLMLVRIDERILAMRLGVE